jgi:hypothetical protein
MIIIRLFVGMATGGYQEFRVMEIIALAFLAAVIIGGAMRGCDWWSGRVGRKKR